MVAWAPLNLRGMTALRCLVLGNFYEPPNGYGEGSDPLWVSLLFDCSLLVG